MFKSFFTWKVGIHLLVVIGLFSGLVWGTFRWLEYHTNYGKEVPVPNVVDMPVHQAVKIIEDMGLSVEVDSFKYEPKYKPFQVLQIYPAAGSRVKEGRSIVLRVNPHTWAKVEVPDILDKYKGLAFSRLELVGLKVGDTIYEPNIQRDAVIRMEMNGETLKPGTLLPKFSVINLIIGSGPLRNISVPNLVGLTVKEARALVAKHHFEVGIVDFADGEDEAAIVYYQDPDRGEIRDQGMQVDLWASKKTPAEMMSKIKELDKIYRRYYPTADPETIDFGFDEPVEKASRPVQEEKEVTANEKKKSSPAKEEKPNNTAKQQPPVEKEKSTTKKKVVIE